jgi:hypothetical protein
MWRNKKWAVVIVLAIVVVMAVGIIGGVVYAQSGATTTPKNPKDTLMSKVAAKLGIDQSKLEDAFTQAEKEMRDDALNTRLDNLVKAGKLTQDQADKYKEWIQTRPDVPGILDGQGMGPRGPMGFKGGPGCFPGSGKFGPRPQPSATPESN